MAQERALSADDLFEAFLDGSEWGAKCCIVEAFGAKSAVLSTPLVQHVLKVLGIGSVMCETCCAVEALGAIPGDAPQFGILEGGAYNCTHSILICVTRS